MGFLDLLPSFPQLLVLLVLSLLWLLWRQGRLDFLFTKEGATKPILTRSPVEEKEEDRVIRIVLIGKTGVGKSATGNSILGSKTAFDPRRGMSSITQVCRRRAVKINNTEVQIVDTPGVLDTDRKESDVEKEITKCICLSAPGPHVFLMVIRAERFTEEEFQAYKMLKSMFGDKVINYMIIAITYVDQLEDMTPEEMLRAAPQNMKQVLKEVKNRYVVFNNKATGEVNDKQVVDLMNRIDDLKSTFSAEEQFFSDTKTEKAEQKIEEEVKQIMGAYNIGEKKAREMLMKQIENEEKNAFLKNVGKAVGIGVLITAAVGMVVVSGGAGIVAIGLAAEGGAAGASAAAAAASASSAVGSLAAADKAKKMCVVM